ncbi:MAG: hypothetical protein HY243_10665 [Proteobacteria bacterium]|nr:hypothetical protein [Pseudomonadota bacterium]
MGASDFCQLAAELNADNGPEALDYARRAVVAFEADGASDRAQFWYLLSVFLDDIVTHRLNPDAAITIH